MFYKGLLTRLLTTVVSIISFISPTLVEGGPALPPVLIRGVVQTSDDKPALFVTISVKGMEKGTVSDEDGAFVLRNLPAGQHTLVASSVRLQPQETTVTVADRRVADVRVTLTETARQLDAVQVRGVRSANEKPVTVGKVAIRPLDLLHPPDRCQ